MCAYVCASVRVNLVCMYVSMQMRARVMCAYVCASVRVNLVYMYVSMQMRACVYVCVRACVLVRARTCVYACFCQYVCGLACDACLCLRCNHACASFHERCLARFEKHFSVFTIQKRVVTPFQLIIMILSYSMFSGEYYEVNRKEDEKMMKEMEKQTRTGSESEGKTKIRDEF